MQTILITDNAGYEQFYNGDTLERLTNPKPTMTFTTTQFQAAKELAKVFGGIDKRIAAIKTIRGFTGMSLLEAKTLYDLAFAENGRIPF